MLKEHTPKALIRQFLIFALKVDPIIQSYAYNIAVHNAFTLYDVDGKFNYAETKKFSFFLKYIYPSLPSFF